MEKKNKDDSNVQLDSSQTVCKLLPTCSHHLFWSCPYVYDDKTSCNTAKNKTIHLYKLFTYGHFGNYKNAFFASILGRHWQFHWKFDKFFLNPWLNIMSNWHPFTVCLQYFVQYSTTDRSAWKITIYELDLNAVAM